LIFDTFPDSEDTGAFEEAVSIASSFACTIQTQESLLDLMFVGLEAYCFTSGRGLASTDKFLEILASVGVCRDNSFKRLAALVTGRAALLSSCICILLKWDEERKNLVQRLEIIGVPVLVIVVENPESSEKHADPEMGDEYRPEKFQRITMDRVREGLAGL